MRQQVNIRDAVLDLQHAVEFGEVGFGRRREHVAEIQRVQLAGGEGLLQRLGTPDELRDVDPLEGAFAEFVGDFAVEAAHQRIEQLVMLCRILLRSVTYV